MIEKLEVRKILLLDDDEDECVLFKEGFESLGLEKEFICLNDANKLEEIIKTKAPDLIFLDINMPRKNGFDCLKLLREKLHYNKPIIMYSNSCLTGDVEKAYSLGANLFVRKPPSVNSIKEVIKEILQKDWTEIEALTKEFSLNKKVMLL